MSTESNRPIEVHSGWSGNKQSIAILQTRPIPAVPDVPLDSIERIRILTESHDQGFSSSLEYQGTREGSYSWFELALVRPTVPPPEPIPDPDHMPGSFASTESSPPAATVAPPPRPSRCLPQLETIARTRLYSNLHARREFLQHEVSFEKPRRDDGPSDSSTEPEPVDPERLTAGQDLVKLARPGDRFVLYAMAQYPAWSNYIRRCRIDVSIRAL
ncbi:uncharacterized protein JCM15063_005102 [Sporobolomyces koalae]|uniref:uncharacterized protein n=1 Tax=Sporobolomyces koalae TaxID=500713 RepID=UPI00317ABDAB